jgi:hypothetical protein
MNHRIIGVFSTLRSNTHRMTIAGCIALMTFVFAACNKKDAVETHIPSAGLMVFDLAPDKDGIGVALSGNLINTMPLGYTSYSGTYRNIYTGNREIEVFDLRDSVFAKSSFNFEDGNLYSLFVTGNNGNYKAITVKDDVDSSATADKAYVRYINAIPDSSAPNVTITAGGSTVSEGMASFNTVSPFTAVTPGDIKIAVSNGGNIATDRTVTVESGKVYTALVIGVPGATDDLRKVQIRYVQNGVIPSTTKK